MLLPLYRLALPARSNICSFSFDRAIEKVVRENDASRVQNNDEKVDDQVKAKVASISDPEAKQDPE